MFQPCLALGLLLVASGAAAGPQDPPVDQPVPADEPASLRPLDRVSFWLGGFQARSDTTISAKARYGDYSAAGRFNLEDDLGMDQRSPVSHARLDFLVGDSQGFRLEYFGYHRSNSRTLAREIEFDGEVYRAEAGIRGEFDYDFASADYRWWFGQGATAYGLGLGVAAYRVQTLLAAEASFQDDSVEASTRSSDHAFAPLLALGWRHGFNQHLRVYADLSGVAKGGGDLSGHIVDAAVGIEWFPFRRLGLAVEYGATRIRLDRERGLVDARLDLELRGPSLFLRLR